MVMHLQNKSVKGVETTIGSYNRLKKSTKEKRLAMRARIFLKNTRRKLTVNGIETIGFDKSKVDSKGLMAAFLLSATKGDTLQGSAGLQGTKKTGIGRTQEGLCQWRQLLLMLWYLVMVLVMIGVIKQKRSN
ncbi:hypothetical protein Tco_0889302 [Tanacetum coccineum]